MALSTHECENLPKIYPPSYPLFWNLVMYLSFSDQLIGKELQSVVAYPSLRQAPFILFTAARKHIGHGS